VSPGLESKGPENPIEAHGENRGESVYEQVARIAYELYLQRVANGAPGSADEDWHRAEQQLGAGGSHTRGLEL
jgi:hypothetical protein